MLFVSCLECGHRAPVQGPLEAALRQRIGLEPGASEEEIADGLRLGEHRLRCSVCGDRRSEIEVRADRACERCGAPIPWQRLEAIPDAVLCVACQESAEVAPARPVEEDLGKCPKCGAPLKTYQRKKAGTSSYFVGCSAFPTCRYKPRA